MLSRLSPEDLLSSKEQQELEAAWKRGVYGDTLQALCARVLNGESELWRGPGLLVELHFELHAAGKELHVALIQGEGMRKHWKELEKWLLDLALQRGCGSISMLSHRKAWNKLLEGIATPVATLWRKTL